VPASTGQIVIVKESDVTREFQAARAFDKYARYLEALPLIFIVLALVVAPARPSPLATAGIVLASSALIRIGLLLGPLESSIKTQPWVVPNSRDAATEAYHVIAMSFVHQDFIVVGVGVAMLAIGLLIGVAKHALMS